MKAALKSRKRKASPLRTAVRVLLIELKRHRDADLAEAQIVRFRTHARRLTPGLANLLSDLGIVPSDAEDNAEKIFDFIASAVSEANFKEIVSMLAKRANSTRDMTVLMRAYYKRGAKR